MTAYRLLALDIDGTLLRSDKTISPRTHQALDAARSAGVHVVLVTGRRYPAARRVAELLRGPTDLVLHNGALIVESRRESRRESSREAEARNPGADPDALGQTADGALILHRRLLPRELAQRAIRAGRAVGADPVVHAGPCGEGRLLVEGVPRSNTLLAYYLDKSHPDVVEVDDLTAALELGEDPLQVMFGGPMADMDRLYPGLVQGLAGEASVERTVYPDSGVGLLDVLAAGVGKREAVALLQRRFQVSPQETIAIGDNWNDRDMLLAAGLGLVMGNAEPGLHALGLPVLPTNDEDGVAVALEDHVLR